MEEDEIIKVQKMNLRQNEETIEKYKKLIGFSKEKMNNIEQKLNLDKEELELIKKLYMQHGEKYMDTIDWKKFMVEKRLPFGLKMNKKGMSVNEQAHMMEHKDFQRAISDAELEVTRCKKMIKDAETAKEKVKNLK